MKWIFRKVGTKNCLKHTKISDILMLMMIHLKFSCWYGESWKFYLLFPFLFIQCYSKLKFAVLMFIFFRWGWRRHPDANPVVYGTRGQAFQVLANPNVCINPRLPHKLCQYNWFRYGQRLFRYVIDGSINLWWSQNI